MSTRRKARKHALDVLYECDLRGLPLGATLPGRVADRVEAAQQPLNPYVAVLVAGVAEHQARIDELLTSYSVGWPLHRMPPVDRNLLRIGAYELLYVDDVPDEVVLSEAVDLARELSTDDSPDFVNGLLGRLRDLKPQLAP